jgi:hypothetical protein
MSNYWSLYCVTCDDECGASWNHGGDRLQRFLGDEDATRALKSISAWYADSDNSFCERMDLTIAGLEGSALHLGHFLIAHEHHEIVVRDEYGAIFGTCATGFDCPECGGRAYCGLPPKHEGSCQRPEPSTVAYTDGFVVAAREIGDGVASRLQAKERGLYPDNQSMRIEWDCGYEDAVCAYRLGYDPQEMARLGLCGPSVLSSAAVIQALLDGTWEHRREDPRRK